MKTNLEPRKVVRSLIPWQKLKVLRKIVLAYGDSIKISVRYLVFRHITLTKIKNPNFFLVKSNRLLD